MGPCQSVLNNTFGFLWHFFTIYDPPRALGYTAWRKGFYYLKILFKQKYFLFNYSWLFSSVNKFKFFFFFIMDVQDNNYDWLYFLFIWWLELCRAPGSPSRGLYPTLGLWGKGDWKSGDLWKSPEIFSLISGFSPKWFDCSKYYIKEYMCTGTWIWITEGSHLESLLTRACLWLKDQKGNIHLNQ